MKKIATILTLTLVINISLDSCKKKNEGPSDEMKAAVISNYSNIIFANYEDVLTQVRALQTAIDVFVTTPSQTNFDAAKAAWKSARVSYGQTEVYRFYGGPIDDDNGPEGLLNAWPLDEVFIDYVQGSPSAGIINKVAAYPTISSAVIEGLNESGGETNISCGFHAVEFLLWGQDFSATTAGNRPYTDYLTTAGTAQNQARRGQYLKACAALLVNHFQYLVDAWSPSGNNYRAAFISGNKDNAIKSIIQGMGFLSKGELAGERLEVVYDSQLQEDEQSCFSDNTDIDIKMNALAIANVFNGSYVRLNSTTISGLAVYDLIKVKNPALADKLKTAIEDSKTKCNAIPAPFDQEILVTNTSGRARIKAAFDALKAQGDLLAQAATDLGLTIVIQ